MRFPFCRHLYWQPMNALVSEFDDSITVSWDQMMCEDCGKVRNRNVLKPREHLVIPVHWGIEEVTND